MGESGASPELVSKRFEKALPGYLDESTVSQFHEIVTLFEEASGEDLSLFRIPDAEVKPRVVRIGRTRAVAAVFHRKCRISGIAMSSFSSDKSRASFSIFKTFNRRPNRRSLDSRRDPRGVNVRHLKRIRF